MFCAVRLNHSVLLVADLERSERLYRDVFGMEVIAREPLVSAAALRLPGSGNRRRWATPKASRAQGPGPLEVSAP